MWTFHAKTQKWRKTPTDSAVTEAKLVHIPRAHEQGQICVREFMNTICVLYDVTRRKGEVIKRLQINNWGGNTRQEAPELRLQVTSQKTKVEMEKTNPSSILYIGAAITENVAVIQVTARKEKERTQVSTTQAQAILKLNEQEQEYRTFITSPIKELQTACEALLLENGNAPTVEDFTMQWKKIRYVAKSAMGSV